MIHLIYFTLLLLLVVSVYKYILRILKKEIIISEEIKSLKLKLMSYSIYDYEPLNFIVFTLSILASIIFLTKIYLNPSSNFILSLILFPLYTVILYVAIVIPLFIILNILSTFIRYFKEKDSGSLAALYAVIAIIFIYLFIPINEVNHIVNFINAR